MTQMMTFFIVSLRMAGTLGPGFGRQFCVPGIRGVGWNAGFDIERPLGEWLRTHNSRTHNVERSSTHGYPGHMQLGGSGVKSLFRGLRTGDAKLMLVGAALLAFGFLRKPRPSRAVYQRRLKPGDTIRIGFEGQDR